MVNIFEFVDFRDYLKKCYEERKCINPKYSYQSFTEKMGFNNRGFMFNVLNKDKKLSISHCYKLSKALKHTKEEAEYFEKIVAYTQAENEEERTYVLQKIQQHHKSKTTPPVLIGEKQFEYLSKWYHSAVRSLIDMFPMGDDFEFISRKIFPPITIAQAKKSVELLIQLEIIIKGNDGIYRCTGKNVRINNDISKAAINQFHIECTELAKQSVIYSASRQHLVSSLTLGISRKTYEIICDETMKFKEKILDLANKDEEADRVYQYQLVLFPLTSTHE